MPSVANLSVSAPAQLPIATIVSRCSAGGMPITHSLVRRSAVKEWLRSLTMQAIRGGVNSTIMCQDMAMTSGPLRWRVASGTTGTGSMSRWTFARGKRRIARSPPSLRAGAEGQGPSGTCHRLPNSAAVSLMRFEKPHSLSYQPITRTSAPSMTWVWVPSKVQEKGTWLRSTETSSSSV